MNLPSAPAVHCICLRCQYVKSRLYFIPAKHQHISNAIVKVREHFLDIFSTSDYTDITSPGFKNKQLNSFWSSLYFSIDTLKANMASSSSVTSYLIADFRGGCQSLGGHHCCQIKSTVFQTLPRNSCDLSHSTADPLVRLWYNAITEEDWSNGVGCLVSMLCKSLII